MRNRNFFSASKKVRISKRITSLRQSTFSKFIGLKGKDIISLGPGEPDFPTPKHIAKAGHNAIDRGFTHYAPPAGYPDLLEAIGKKLKIKNKINVQDPHSQICVTAGSTESLLLSMFASLDPRNQILIPDPGYFTYHPASELVGAKPVSYPLSDSDGFQLHLDEIKRLVTPKTKAIVINSPSNPTGTVYSKKLLEELADLAIEKDLTIISDEAYENCVFNGERHVSIASLNGMENNTLSNFTFSKPYAMAGWRVGYVVGNEEAIGRIKNCHLLTSVSASSVSQQAALAALNGSQKCVEDMRKEYDRRRKLIIRRIQEIKGFDLKVVPSGAFYIFPKIFREEIKHVYHHMNVNSEQFSLWLFDKIKVIVMPGIEFGENGEGFVRMSYATDFKLIGEAMDRLENLFGSR